MGLSDVKTDGETNGLIPCYNVMAKIKGEECYAQFTKQGGHLLMYSYAGSCNMVNYDEDKAIEEGLSFLLDIGIDNMKAVWTNLSNNVYTINFAYEIDDVKVYADLIKIRVCAETNTIIGFEGSSYYTNHTERLVDKGGLTSEQAKAKLNSSIEIESVDLALVPIGNESEKLCYEFCGLFDGETYYIYIDIVSGAQVEMFKVVENSEGKLLI